MGGWVVHADGAARLSLLAAAHLLPAFVILGALV
jgi:hypothetical protein